MFEDVFAEQQHRVGVSLHLLRLRRAGVRPGPEDPARAEVFAVDPLCHGGQHHPLLHKGQQLKQLVLRRHRGGRVREQNAWKPAPDDGGRWRDGGGRQIHDPDVSALDLTLEDLLAQITDRHFEGVLSWRAKKGGGVNGWRAFKSQTGPQATFRLPSGDAGTLSSILTSSMISPTGTQQEANTV